MILKYTIDKYSNGKTIKEILKNKLKISEKLLKRLKYSQNIFLNSQPVHVNAQVSQGDIVEAVIDFQDEATGIIPQNLPLNIIHEDEAIIVIDKEPNIVVHPTWSHPAGTIANGLLYILQQRGQNKIIRPVSRLDRDTSGIIIFAQNQYVQEHLIRQITAKSFVKEYLGIVYGNMSQNSGTINLPIARKPGSIMLREISRDGVHSITHYEVLEQLNNAAFLKFTLETGRTHQIRVHCQAIGHPLIGDTLYSDIPSSFMNRQALHSHKVNFIHPITMKSMEIISKIPHDMLNVLEIMRK